MGRSYQPEGTNLWRQKCGSLWIKSSRGRKRSISLPYLTDLEAYYEARPLRQPLYATVQAQQLPQEDLANDILSDSPDLVEDMLKGFSSLTKDDYYSEALVAMAKQYRAMKANPSRLVSAMHCFGKAHVSTAAKRATALRRAARRPDPMIPSAYCSWS
ncbi:hypothetical protein J4Q44_G00113710 [Coregonus suidteri]|uniref:Uncharacterized protein n=1 Tax=Coregonus suidteri TaxID=861788 RepID=A0AAN8QVG7_9TELE